MHIFPGSATPLRPADTSSFVGPARTKLLATSDEHTPVHVYRVEFESGGRTNWHTHSGPQWLFVIEGQVRVQNAGAPALDVDAGDAVMIPPGEKHWHGACPGARGVHIAVNVRAETTWLEPVSDEEYGV
jgi:quercetin dioxygenase-like cupin family protein